MLITKVIDLNAPLTPEQEAELDALSKMSDDDIVYDEECPPQTVQTRKPSTQGQGGWLITLEVMTR